jgi:hypothetical protein
MWAFGPCCASIGLAKEMPTKLLPLSRPTLVAGEVSSPKEMAKGGLATTQTALIAPFHRFPQLLWEERLRHEVVSTLTNGF